MSTGLPRVLVKADTAVMPYNRDMNPLDLPSLMLYVLLAATTAAGSGLVGLVGWWLKKQGLRLLNAVAAAEQLSAGVSHLQESVNHLQLGIDQLRTNGHMFADRVTGIERRVQQGAEELNDLRRRVNTIE